MDIEERLEILEEKVNKLENNSVKQNKSNWLTYLSIFFAVFFSTLIISIILTKLGF